MILRSLHSPPRVRALKCGDAPTSFLIVKSVLPRPGSAFQVFLVFLRLGLTSFGGPMAHIGYFRSEFVDRRRWLDDRDFSDLLALCQFLPGPASTKLCMALGLMQARWAGMLAAWAGFALPSAFALMIFAEGMVRYDGLADAGWIHGLKVATVAVVAHAVWGMAKSLCPDRSRAITAMLASLLVLALPSSLGQIAAIVLAAAVGRWLLPSAAVGGGPGADTGGDREVAVHFPVTHRAGAIALGLFAVLLASLPFWSVFGASKAWTLVEGVYRSGALVFGGGHVVLPLLQASVVPPGFMDNADFLAGYGAAQAVPGPLFTFAAYIGAVAEWPLQGWLGGLFLTAVIFVPGALLLVGALPFWQRFRHARSLRSTMAGINAGVVGILISALYDPVWTSAIHDRADFGLALAAFALLVYSRVSPVIVVLLAALAGWATNMSWVAYSPGGI